MKINDKKLRKRLINDVLNGEDILADIGSEKYLEKNLEQSIYFYAIDINFWHLLLEPKANAPDYLDNSKIAEEINVMKIEDIYKKIESERINRQSEEERKKRKKKKKKLKKILRKKKIRFKIMLIMNKLRQMKKIR